jgi:perosamine synthetase
MGAEFIPVYSPNLSGEEWSNVRECLETNWISSKGRFVSEFEGAFSQYVGANSSISVCNGTVALNLALLALKIGPGCKVAVPTFAYVAAANCIRYVGAEPVFVDVDPVTWQLSPEDLERKAKEVGLAAVVVVHTYGQPADIIEIKRIASSFRFSIVEDCAESFGSKVGARHVGIDADVATYSFFGNKTITTGEGGMVTTCDPDLDKMMRKLRGQGLSDSREYWHDVVGYNYRMTNICAAIGLAQIQRADALIARKRAIAQRYQSNLKDLPLHFHEEAPNTTHSFWMCSIVTEETQQRDALRNHLKISGIETRPFFPPLHAMPMYRKWDLGPYPCAEFISQRGINLPSFPSLTDVQIDRISDAIRGFFKP